MNGKVLRRNLVDEYEKKHKGERANSKRVDPQRNSLNGGYVHGLNMSNIEKGRTRKTFVVLNDSSPCR
jgi:hypothetical protein